MGLLDVWVVYDGGLLVHDDPECRRYADNKPNLDGSRRQPLWRGESPLPEPIVNDGTCHHCGKPAWSSPWMVVYEKRDFCHPQCVEAWAEQRRLDRLDAERRGENEQRMRVLLHDWHLAPEPSPPPVEPDGTRSAPRRRETAPAGRQPVCDGCGQPRRAARHCFPGRRRLDGRERIYCSLTCLQKAEPPLITAASIVDDVHLPSPAEIENARSAGGGWSQATLAAWGVPWPPPEGWRADLEQRWRESGSAIA